jgi:hypothetical protein
MAAPSSSHVFVLWLSMSFVSHVDTRLQRVPTSNMTCMNINLATMSSRSDDRFTQMKLFASPQFMSNYTTSCGKFEV